MCFMGIISETDRGYQGHGRHGTRINGRQDEPVKLNFLWLEKGTF